jgi:hypothetical protein
MPARKYVKPDEARMPVLSFEVVPDLVKDEWGIDLRG